MSQNLIREKDLRGFKYFTHLFSALEKFHHVDEHHNRQLHYDEYITLILFYFFNPILTSLRGIREATTLEKVQKEFKVKATSLGSLSEASCVFDPELIMPLIKDLAKEALPLEKDPQLKKIIETIVAVDGTLLPALPKMLWALWLDDEHRAAKLHLEFDIMKFIPNDAVITHGNGNEKMVLRKKFLGPAKLFVLDAGYGEYKLLCEIVSARSSFVIRLHDNAVWGTIEQRSLSKEAKDAGVTKDMIAYLGSDKKRGDYPSPLRIIEIFHKGNPTIRRKSRMSSKKTFRTKDTDYTMLLATDRMDLPAEVIAMLYQYRWQVELFFRWFKCILGCKHLLAHSHNGVSIQVYCALIASMLITIRTGKKPTKRTFEMLAFYFMGWASSQELEDHLKREQEKIEKKSA
jgi:hypothetical protein